MKVKKLLGEAKNELEDEKATQVLDIIKLSLKRIASAKKTLKALEDSHNKLLNSDIDDLELDDYEY